VLEDLGAGNQIVQLAKVCVFGCEQKLMRRGVRSDLLVLCAEQADLSHMDGVRVYNRRASPPDGRRGFHQGVASRCRKQATLALDSKRQSCADILYGEIREVLQDLLLGHTASKVLQ
jgi:hypothetical protein